MANANITVVNLVNTFDEWRAATNDLIEDRNNLRNSSYVKDNSDFKIANGVLRVANTANGTIFVIEGYANAYVGGDTSTGNLTVRANATIGNLTVLGKQTNFGDVLNDSNTIILRTSATTDGDGRLRVYRGAAGKNAEILFDNTANVWQTNFDTSTQTYKTILTTANVIDSVTSTSTTNAAAPNSVRTAYDLAGVSANTSRVSANGGSTLSNRQLNFVNTATVTVSVVDGAGAAAGNANISFTAIGGGGGLTNFPVTRGNATAVTIAAQGVTFNNSSSIGITVTSGINGNANVIFETISGGGSQGTTGAQGTTGSQGTQGLQGLQGTQASQGVQGIQGLTGPNGTQFLRHVSDGYTSSAKVFVRSTAPPSGNTQGDIWLDTSGTEGFAQSLSSSGYTKLPNGMIMQWGVWLATSPPQFVGSVAITFPTAFPTACLNASATTIFDSSVSACDAWGMIHNNSLTTTGMTVEINANQSGGGKDAKGFYWMAIGY